MPCAVHFLSLPVPTYTGQPAHQLDRAYPSTSPRRFAPSLWVAGPCSEHGLYFQLHVTIRAAFLYHGNGDGPEDDPGVRHQPFLLPSHWWAWDSLSEHTLNTVDPTNFTGLSWAIGENWAWNRSANRFTAVTRHSPSPRGAAPRPPSSWPPTMRVESYRL